MQELLAHGNAEAADSDLEFAEQLLQVATDYARYKQNAIKASRHLEKLIERSKATLTDSVTRSLDASRSICCRSFVGALVS